MMNNQQEFNSNNKSPIKSNGGLGGGSLTAGTKFLEKEVVGTFPSDEEEEGHSMEQDYFIDQPMGIPTMPEVTKYRVSPSNKQQSPTGQEEKSRMVKQ